MYRASPATSGLLHRRHDHLDPGGSRSRAPTSQRSSRAIADVALAALGRDDAWRRAAARRSTAGPIREFDYNIDGLSHYGMLPDMLQDLQNVGSRGVLDQFFRSAERYVEVWERSVHGASRIPHP